MTMILSTKAFNLCPRGTLSILRWAASGMNLADGDTKSAVSSKATIALTHPEVDPNVFLWLEAEFDRISEEQDGLLTQTDVCEIIENIL